MSEPVQADRCPAKHYNIETGAWDLQCILAAGHDGPHDGPRWFADQPPRGASRA